MDSPISGNKILLTDPDGNLKLYEIINNELLNVNQFSDLNIISIKCDGKVLIDDLDNIYVTKENNNFVKLTPPAPLRDIIVDCRPCCSYRNIPMSESVFIESDDDESYVALFICCVDIFGDLTTWIIKTDTEIYTHHIKAPNEIERIFNGYDITTVIDGVPYIYEPSTFKFYKFEKTPNVKLETIFTVEGSACTKFCSLDYCGNFYVGEKLMLKNIKKVVNPTFSGNSYGITFSGKAINLYEFIYPNDTDIDSKVHPQEISIPGQKIVDMVVDTNDFFNYKYYIITKKGHLFLMLIERYTEPINCLINCLINQIDIPNEYYISLNYKCNQIKNSNC